MSDILEELPLEIGTAYSFSSPTSLNVPASMRWDVNIGGLPFLFAQSPQYPTTYETAPFRREVVTGAIVGEQALDSGFWLRSQGTWHYGSGLSSAEPVETSESEVLFRYKSGGGVDPWTPAKVTLLKDTSLYNAGSGTSQRVLGVDTGVLHADGTTLTYVTTAGTPTAVTWGGSATDITALVTDGASYYAANDTGIYKGALPSSSGSLAWNTGGTTTLGWVKSRLMAAIDQSIYELVAGSPPTLPSALYTHPNASWYWSDFAEGPQAIYVSGYSGDQSQIFRISVVADETTVTLSQPVVVAEMPRGEQVVSLYSYVGTYLSIGTTKGVRIALINSDGSLTMGPLVVESSDGCYDAVADGSFLYVTVGSQGNAGDRALRGGLYRIDLGTNLNSSPLEFAAAADLVVPSGVTGAATQVTTAGGFLWFAVQGTGVYRQSADYVATGWFETGRIRLGTIEAKAWREIRLIQDPGTTGTVQAYGSVDDTLAPSTWSPLLTIGSTVDLFDGSGSLNPAAPGRQASLFLAFKLTRGDASHSPSFVGYQAKAIPAPDRSTLLQVGLMCFDRETDRKGAMYGIEGGSFARYQVMKQLEQSAATVLWRDYTTGDSGQAYIERVNLTRTTPPSKNFTGTGGILTLTIRLV